MYKLKMISGEKEYKFSHIASYKLKKLTNSTAIEYYYKYLDNTLDFSILYELMYVGLVDNPYNSIEDMLEDMHEENEHILEYGKIVGEAMGKHFTAMIGNTNQESEK